MKILHLAWLALFLAVSPASAALYTYQLTNVPGVQDANTLDGNITINTAGGTEDSGNSGNFWISHSDIVVWNYTVTLSEGGGYTGSSLDTNASTTGAGGVMAFYATPTSLTIVAGASLILQSEPLVVGQTQQLEWIYSTPLYAFGGTALPSAEWITLDRSALDAAFPANPDASATSWTFATAVPEPSISLLCILGCSLLLRRRRV